jgi:FkbM family methyltransferase
MDGLNLSINRFFEVYLKWKCINVEPDPFSFEKLKINRPKSINLNYAFSDKDEVMKFYCNSKRPKNSFVLNEENSKKVRDKTNKSIIDVNCIAYKTLIDTVLIPQYSIDHIDLLVLDVENHEAQVAEGIKNATILPTVICVEITYYRKDILEKFQNSLPMYRFVFNKKYNYVFAKQ